MATEKQKSQRKKFKDNFTPDTSRWEIWELERAEYECVERDLISLGQYRSIGHVEVERYMAEVTYGRFGLSCTGF